MREKEDNKSHAGSGGIKIVTCYLVDVLDSSGDNSINWYCTVRVRIPASGPKVKENENGL
jgi:hypothetical protein